MKVILQQDVDFLGQMGDIVKVKAGYGRNYLIPRGLAIIANEKNERQLKHFQSMAQAKAAKELAEAKAFAAKIEAVKIGFVRNSSDENKMFGSVTTKDIVEALKEKDCAVNRKDIVLEEPIREFGSFDVSISLKRGVKATVSVIVQQK